MADHEIGVRLAAELRWEATQVDRRTAAVEVGLDERGPVAGGQRGRIDSERDRRRLQPDCRDDRCHPRVGTGAVA